MTDDDGSRRRAGAKGGAPSGRAGEGIVGRRVGGEPADEREHFHLCARCGQAFDKRDLRAVIHHEQPGHRPLPVS